MGEGEAGRTLLHVKRGGRWWILVLENGRVVRKYRSNRFACTAEDGGTAT
jgi:hypothetical protein